MPKLTFKCILLCMLISSKGLAQPPTQASLSAYSYRPLSEEKLSWQRLTLWLSGNFYRGMKLSTIDGDSSLLDVSKFLGISRLPYTAEGIDDPELLEQSKWFDDRKPGEGIRQLAEAKGKKRIELLLLLGAYYSFQPAAYKRYKDSVEFYLKKVIAERQSSEEKRLGRVALCLFIKVYGQGNDTANSKAAFNQLLTECQSAGDRKTEARGYAYRGLYTAIKQPITQASIDDKLAYYQKSAEIYHSLNDAEGEIAVKTSAGLMSFVVQRLDDSYTLFSKALELEYSIGYPYTHYNTDHLAMVGMFQDKYGEPLKYAIQSVKTAEATKDTIGLGYFYDKLGSLYYMVGQRPEEGMKWMQKALNRFIIDKNGAIMTCLNNIVGFMNDQKGREQEALDLALDISNKFPAKSAQDLISYNMLLSGCYISLAKYDLAEQYFATADSIQKASPGVGAAGAYQRENLNHLQIRLLMAKSDFKEARKLLENSLINDAGVSLITDQLNTYKRLIMIDSVLQDNSSGVKHYGRYMALVDSNFKVASLRQAEELKVEYETEEKQKEITLLNQQAILEKANLKQATLVKNLTIAGIIAVLIIAGLLYRQNRLKQKNNNVITRQNEQLQHFLTEKEWLLKEIHHRVKNNLQIVMSLLNSQSAYIDNGPALTAIHDSQHRVHAMSLIHQKLYNSDNLSSIDMTFYIRELVSYLADSFDTGQRIRFEFAIEPLEMDVSQAVPLGLILNEAITNSIKYAFPDDRSGVISISLSETSPHHYLLNISDNGIGMPAQSFDIKKPGSLGMSLMAGLSEDLDGNFAIENNNGTTIKISFVYDLGVKRPTTLAESFVSNN
jgi:two-component sensor histidine kinase